MNNKKHNLSNEDINKKQFKKKQVLYLIISFLFLIFFEKLIESTAIQYSMDYIVRAQNISKFKTKFYKFIANFSTEEVIAPLMFILYFAYPINISFTLFRIYYIAKYIDSVLKISFTSPRPFWLNHSLILKCHSGYGNPSGHCFGATSFYLAFSHTIIKNTKFINNNIYIKLFVWILTLILLFLIAMSRILFAYHTIDQCVLGCILGAMVYYYFYHIRQSAFTKKTEYEFIKSYAKKFDLRKNMILLLSCLFINTLCFYIFYSEKWTQKYLDTFNAIKCSKYAKKVKLPSEKGYVISLSIFGYFGAIYGLLFLDYKLRSNNTFFKLFEAKKMKDKVIIIFGTFLVYLFIALVLHEYSLIPFCIRVPAFCFFFTFGLLGFVSLSKYSLVNQSEYEFGDIDDNYKSNIKDDEEDSTILINNY